MSSNEFITTIAKGLDGRTMTVPKLAELLNTNGYKTSYGEKYLGGRGTYRKVKTTYDWNVSINKQEDANAVALAFVKPNGDYAYKPEE